MMSWSFVLAHTSCIAISKAARERHRGGGLPGSTDDVSKTRSAVAFRSSKPSHGIQAQIHFTRCPRGSMLPAKPCLHSGMARGGEYDQVSRRGVRRSRGGHCPSHARPRRPRRPGWRPRLQWAPWVARWSPFLSAAILRLGRGRWLDGPGASRRDTAVRNDIDRCRSASRSEVRVSADTELAKSERFAHGHRAAWLADRSPIVSGRSLRICRSERRILASP
jgi:hypothetical protein